MAALTAERPSSVQPSRVDRRWFHASQPNSLFVGPGLDTMMASGGEEFMKLIIAIISQTNWRA